MQTHILYALKLPNCLNELVYVFIGVIKAVTKSFPMNHLSEIELKNREERRGLSTHIDDGKHSLLACI